MTDVTQAMAAKSDQLNAVDIMGSDRVIRINKVDVRQGDQPISIYFDGDNRRPWKPSKGMIRILAGAWGTDSAAWVGRFAQLYFEPEVIYAGKPVGGIRIRALSDIPAKGLQFVLTINRQKRIPYPVAYLDTSRPAYPAEKFDAGFEAMADAMQSGKMTLQNVIAQCQKTGDLTAEQIARLEAAAPIEADGDAEQPH